VRHRASDLLLPAVRAVPRRDVKRSRGPRKLAPSLPPCAGLQGAGWPEVLSTGRKSNSPYRCVRRCSNGGFSRLRHGSVAPRMGARCSPGWFSSVRDAWRAGLRSGWGCADPDPHLRSWHPGLRIGRG
jgi:hypothetical protein